MLRLGLTGGLASGKTSIAKMYAGLGAYVLDADKIAHRALHKNTDCYKQIIVQFGKSILNKDGSINRKRLAKLAFASIVKQKKLCSIVHPWVFAYIRKKIKKIENNKANKAVIVEAVLLIESGLYKEMDKILLVRSTIAQQILRAAARKMTKEQAKQRMSYQMLFVQKSKYADYIIDNRGALKNTEKIVRKIWELILKTSNL